MKGRLVGTARVGWVRLQVQLVREHRVPPEIQHRFAWDGTELGLVPAAPATHSHIAAAREKAGEDR